MVDPELRFWRSVEWAGPSAARPDLGPCLVFLGSRNSSGYGQFRFDDRNGYAHRYAWQRVHGPIPDDLTVDHLCRVRTCCNTAHMELVTGVENYRRAMLARTHCVNGHEYTGERDKDGHRVCRPCIRKDQEKYEAKRRAATAARGDGRVRYDQQLKAECAADVLAGRSTVRAAAMRLGCSVKYMDKYTRQLRAA